MQKHKVPFNGKLLSAVSLGNTKNVPIVFIHGNSMSSKIWQKQFEKSLSDNYYLISYDLPGHGESDNLDTYSLSILAESITAVSEHFKLKHYVLVGNSLGGDLILQISHQLKNCKGILLVNTPPVSKPPAMEKSFLPNPNVGMFFTKEYDTANLNVFAAMLFTDVNHIPDFIKSDFQRTDGNSRQSLAEDVGALNYIDEVEALKNLVIPVVMIAGKNEKMINNEYYKTLDIPTLWQNKIHIVEESAHCPQWENSISFNTLLKDFCESIYTSPLVNA